MSKYFFAALIFALVNTQVSVASEVAFVASAPAQVGVGERFRLVFSVNKRPVNFNPPAITDFRIVSGPSQSSSTSVQMINGQVSQTENHTFSYILEAGREGSFTVPGATVTVNGREYRSNSLSILISGQAPQAARPAQADPQQPEAVQITGRDLFIRATASNSNPFVGQQVVVTYRLYTRVTVAQYSIEKTPGFQGFWAEDITPQDQPRVTEEVIDGQRYNVAIIRQVVVFPQRSGQLTIEPLELVALVRVAAPRRTGSLFDDFFGGSVFGAFQTVEHRSNSNPVQIIARDLPTANRPSGFNGAVGSFELKTSLSPQTVNVNEPVTLSMSISGSGNLKMIVSPEVKFPPNLEVFDPNITENIQSGTSGVTGSRTFEYLIIPRVGGSFEIPPVQFSFFDPAVRKYVTRRSEGFRIEVSGDGMLVTSAAPGAMRTDVVYLTSDIRFIQNQLFRLQPIGVLFFKSTWYFALMALPLVLFGVFLIFWKRHARLQRDIALLKNRKAQKTAKKRLKKAAIYLNESKAVEFYEEIFKALWGYVADKFNIPVFKLNKDNVVEVFIQKGLPHDIADQFLTTLDECEFARFAPGSPQRHLDETYQKTMEMLVTLEKNLKND